MTRIKARNCCSAALLAWTLGLQPALVAEDEAEVFSAKAAVLVVELPVRVLAAGQPVTGLTADDFEIYDRGQRRELLGFEVLDTRSTDSEGSPASEPAHGSAIRPRHWIFLFDLAYADGLSLSKALDATRLFVDRELVPGDQVALAFFSALRGLKLLAEPTDDRERLTQNLDLVAALLAHDIQAVEALAAALGVSEYPSQPDLVSTGELRGEAGIMFRADPYWPHRSVIRAFARSLAELAANYSDLPGQRTLVLYSHGFDPKYLVGRGSVGTLGELERAFKACRSAGWVVQSINVGGLRALAGRESLFYLAHETGGESFENFNNLNEALQLMVRHGSITYVLSFQVDDPRADGSFHRLRVKLRPGLERARLVHRPGYYSPSPDSQPALDTPRDRR